MLMFSSASKERTGAGDGEDDAVLLLLGVSDLRDRENSEQIAKKAIAKVLLEGDGRGRVRNKTLRRDSTLGEALVRGEQAGL